MCIRDRNSTVKRDKNKIGVAPHCNIHNFGKNWFIEIEYLGLEKQISYHVYPFEFRNTNTGIIERFVWSKGYYKILLDSCGISKFRDFFFNDSQNDLINNWYNSMTQLVVPLESTSSPYDEWKAKCKDYHSSSPSETDYIPVNLVPYLYEYEGIIQLLFTTNSGINGA